VSLVEIGEGLCIVAGVRRARSPIYVDGVRICVILPTTIGSSWLGLFFLAFLFCMISSYYGDSFHLLGCRCSMHEGKIRGYCKRRWDSFGFTGIGSHICIASVLKHGQLDLMSEDLR
jgi:hypothetical protein